MEKLHVNIQNERDANWWFKLCLDVEQVRSTCERLDYPQEIDLEFPDVNIKSENECIYIIENYKKYIGWMNKDTYIKYMIILNNITQYMFNLENGVDSMKYIV